MKKIEQLKILWKPFLVLFLIGFLAWNWNDISLFFNYRLIAAKLADFFPSAENPAQAEALSYLEKENWLEIPKIGIEAPLGFVESSEKENTKDLKKYLDKGALHYPGSALPGEQGRTVILGHSAPAGWPKIKYDWVFSSINKLEPGDEVYVYFNDQRYVYEVRNEILLERGEEIPFSDLTKTESVLILLSCWPPGKDYKRIAIEAVLQ